jgi:hypothetical protein
MKELKREGIESQRLFDCVNASLWNEFFAKDWHSLERSIKPSFLLITFSTEDIRRYAAYSLLINAHFARSQGYALLPFSAEQVANSVLLASISFVYTYYSILYFDLCTLCLVCMYVFVLLYSLLSPTTQLGPCFSINADLNDTHTTSHNHSHNPSHATPRHTRVHALVVTHSRYRRAVDQCATDDRNPRRSCWGPESRPGTEQQGSDAFSRTHRDSDCATRSPVKGKVATARQ